METILQASLLLFWAATVYGYIGYDCGGPALNITTISLLDIGKCVIPENKPQEEPKYVQLLQLAEFNSIEVKQCKVEIDRTVLYCGMSSHNSLVSLGRRVYLMEVSMSQCLQMHHSGFLDLGGNHFVRELKRNGTTYATVDYAGTMEGNGDCKGASFIDPYGTYKNVIAEMIVKVTLQHYFASARISTNEVIFRTGTRCSFSEGSCVDPDGGWTFWTPLPSDNCSFRNYDVLYEGIATKLLNPDNETLPVIHTLSSNDITFALTKTSETVICSYKIIKTEHPKLFIVETTKEQAPVIKNPISVNNLDIFAYVNSKFVYVEKHFRSQLDQLYHDVLKQKCNLEREVLENRLSLAAVSPEEFAFRLMKKPGYMAITAGDVIHVINCIPVELKLRQTEKCYAEMPAFQGNMSIFISPKSRIIMQKGTERECNNLLPVMYQIDNTWYKLIPKPVESLPPQMLNPSTKPTWKYFSPGSLATSGIYSDNDLAKLRDHIMYPLESPALVNTIVRGAMGHQVPEGSFSFYNLMDEKTISKIAKTASERVWNGFITFGSASAGILGIWVTIRVIKLVIDTILHGYAIYSIFGWSYHLLAAFWDSVTNLILHLAAPPKKTQQEPLQEVVVVRPEVEGRQVFPPTVSSPREIPLNEYQPAASCPVTPIEASTNSNLYPPFNPFVVQQK